MSCIKEVTKMSRERFQELTGIEIGMHAYRVMCCAIQTEGHEEESVISAHLISVLICGDYMVSHDVADLKEPIKAQIFLPIEKFSQLAVCIEENYER